MPERKKSKSAHRSAAPGAFWSGTITFGLVSVPVHLYPAHRQEQVELRMLGPDGTPVARRYYCEHDGREVSNEHLVHGFEIESGKHVIVTDDELERLAPKRSRDIELRRFVEVAKLDPIRFDRPYFLTPASDNTKAYRLLAQVMERGKRAGIATFVMNGKEHIVAILAEGGILRAETLRFSDEIRTPKDVGLPKPAAPERGKVSAFQKAITSRAKASLSEPELEDEYVAGVKKLVAKKRRQGGKVIQFAKRKPADDEEDEESVDLVEVLRRTLAGASPGPRKRGANRPRRSASKT